GGDADPCPRPDGRHTLSPLGPPYYLVETDAWQLPASAREREAPLLHRIRGGASLELRPGSQLCALPPWARSVGSPPPLGFARSLGCQGSAASNRRRRRGRHPWTRHFDPGRPGSSKTISKPTTDSSRPSVRPTRSP